MNYNIVFIHINCGDCDVVILKLSIIEIGLCLAPPCVQARACLTLVPARAAAHLGQATPNPLK